MFVSDVPPYFVQSDLGKELDLRGCFVVKKSVFDTETGCFGKMTCSNCRFAMGVEKNTN